MAIRFTKYGAQSYDPLEKFKKKKEIISAAPKKPTQIVEQLSPGTIAVRNVPEETARQQGLARIKGNVPLPPETQYERQIKEREIQKLAEEQPLPTIEEMQAQQNIPKEPLKTVEIGKPSGVRLTIPEHIEIGIKENVSAALDMIKILTEVWDVTKKMFTQKKPLKYQNALEGLDARLSIVKNNVMNAKAGEPYYNAENDLRLAVAEFTRLQESTKGLGKANPNWLIDEGISIQAEIAVKLNELNSLRTDLAIIKARQQYGQ